ncbi:class F sortase [Candidatus Roizmanbacteria bacterium]|nr:class F sortase [Candidatus Roizmanbacteria bacterium]
MKKAVFIGILLGVIAVVGIYIGFLRPQPEPLISTVVSTVYEQQVPTITSAPIVTLPIRLIIPKLGVDTVIEHVGLAPDDRMDVPKNADQVAWYNLGPKPGEAGSAVIAGHLDKPGGTPAVFYRLNELQSGDELIIMSQDMTQQTFRVVNTEVFDDATFPIDLVFGGTERRMLNLITCAGTFNRDTRLYSDRTVVFTEAIN